MKQNSSPPPRAPIKPLCRLSSVITEQNHFITGVSFLQSDHMSGVHARRRQERKRKEGRKESEGREKSLNPLSAR